MIVHDMRTPLTVTQLALQVFLMTYGTSLDAKGVGILRRALASGETLIEMVSSLLDISRMEAGEMPLDITRCDVAALLREAWERVEPLRGHREFALEAPETAVVAPCDAGLIGRVTQNLLANALKFAPDNSAVQAGVLARDETCDVYVRDSGQGIPAAYHQRIFEKFGQVETRATGQVPSTGLGLAFCKLAVEAHGGRIWVESEEGQGSIFWFTLPVARV